MTGSHKTVWRDGSIRLLYGPRMSHHATNRPRVRCPRESPAKRRDGDRMRKPKMMKPGTTVETSDDVHAARLVERMVGQVSANVAATRRRCSREPVAPKLEADLIRITPMVVAAKMLLFFLVVALESKTPERAQVARPAPPREAAWRRDEHQKAATTREEKVIRGSSFPCPYNDCAEPRGSATPYHGRKSRVGSSAC